MSTSAAPIHVSGPGCRARPVPDGAGHDGNGHGGAGPDGDTDGWDELAPSADIERWLLDVKADPRRHLARAEAGLAAIGPDPSPLAARLHRLAAAAALELDLATIATDHARQAVRLARRGGE